MGIYVNPDNMLYTMLTRNQVFVDHSLLLEYTNSLLGSESRFLCVSRPRRFGKSTDANMLVAYYSKGCDSSSLFESLKISKTKGYQKHLNQHHVIHLNIQNFLSDTHSIEEMIALIRSEIADEIEEMTSIPIKEKQSLSNYLLKNNYRNNLKFIFILDEWDCIFREYEKDKEAQKVYLDFLRTLFKDQVYVELVYMTGILPIKKYGTHSAINMFKEISILNPTPLENFTGFMESEVQELCKQFDVDYTKMKEWYDGYRLAKDKYSYNPLSVVYALTDHKFENYWTQTETYEALKIYIDMNFDGLKEAIIQLLAGEAVKVNPDKFQNDMTSLTSKDDVLTLMIHLGYLGYNREEESCYIPNKEVRSAFVNSVDTNNMAHTAIALQNANALLEATWKMEEEKVAQYIEEAHLETSHFQYNDENALSYTISLAYYTAKDKYTIVREYPSGKGYADIVFLPKGNEPAMVVELKWKESTESAIHQIQEKNYTHGLEKYKENLLLVGISYDPKTRKHTCKIVRA